MADQPSFRIGTSTASYVPLVTNSNLKIITGSFTTPNITVGSNAQSNVTFTGNFTFNSAPTIICTCTDSYGQFTSTDVENPTTTGFQSFTFVNPSSSGGTRSYLIKYIAIGS